jgi:hypothetical protein
MQNLIKQREKLLRRLVDAGHFIKGSITAVCGTCGRAHCVCARTSKAKAYRLTYKDGDQKTQIVYIPRRRLAEMKRQVASYGLARALIEQIIQTNIALFKQGGGQRVSGR